MSDFAQWLRYTPLSLFIQSVEWIIPLVQTIHIVAIGIAIGSAFMISARVLGWLGTSWAPAEVADRFRPWLLGAIVILALSGLLLIVGEPARELLALSFWMKMTALAAALTISLSLARQLRRGQAPEEAASPSLPRLRASVALVLWAAVIVLGRFIAYDSIIWGAVSPPSA